MQAIRKANSQYKSVQTQLEEIRAERRALFHSNGAERKTDFDRKIVRKQQEKRDHDLELALRLSQIENDQEVSAKLQSQQETDEELALRLHCELNS